MACLELNSTHCFPGHEVWDESFNLQIVDSLSAKNLEAHDACSSFWDTTSNIPVPPPLPGAFVSSSKCFNRLNCQNYVADATREAWDKLFLEGYQADVRIFAEDNSVILAHSSVLGNSSHVVSLMLDQARIRQGFRIIRIPGMSSKAVSAFVRFLYSSCYEPDIMKKYVLHLLVLSHSYVVPRLKMTCAELIERELLSTSNVVDVLQLARLCDAPRLTLVCMRMIINEFRTISMSEGWKIMKLSKPSLEQELLECLVEEDSKKQERLKTIGERKVYKQLYEAMEALLHICRDGCQTIGPRDKGFNNSDATCKYSACKGLESLVRHFSTCRTRIPGGCAQCKRMWQLLELHSRMCIEPDLCKVPLCSHFKDKMQNLSKKEDRKWKLLVSKVMTAKGTISSITARKWLVSNLN